MTLPPKTLSLLDGLCFARANHCRVKELHRFGLMVRMHELRNHGLIGPEGYEPSAFVMDLWRAKQTQLATIDEAREGVGEEAPRPEAAADGDGVALEEALSPKPKRFDERRSAARADGIAGSQLASLLDECILLHGLSTTAVALHLFGQTGGIAILRHTAMPRAKTVEKIRAFLASPPPEGLRSRAPHGDRRYSENKPHEPAPRTCPPASARRDPTTKPETPEIDWAERERLKAQRHIAAARKRVMTEAQRMIAEGKHGRNHAVRSAMQELTRHAAEEFRSLDSLEQAKSKLQRRYQPVCSMAVYGGRADRYVVGSKRDLTEAQLLEMAGRAG